MNILDIGIGVGLILAFFLGWKIRVARLAGIWMANHFQGQVAEVFTSFSPENARLAAWFILFVAALITVGLLGGMVLQAAQAEQLRWLDEILGAILAGAVFLVMATIGMITLQELDRSNPFALIQKSLFAPRLIKLVEPAYRSSLKEFPKVRKFFTEDFESKDKPPK